MAAPMEDRVVNEVPVYLSQGASFAQWLLQFPNKVVGLNFDGSDDVSSKVKPNQKRVLMNVPVDTDSPHYSRDRADTFASLKHDRVRSSEVTTLDSSPSRESCSKYAVALLHDGGLYVSPIDGLIRLTPDLKRMNNIDGGISSLKVTDGDDSQDEEMKQVQVKYRRGETLEAKGRRLASHEHQQLILGEEQWINCRFNHPSSRRSSQVADKLTSKVHRSNGIIDDDDDDDDMGQGQEIALPYISHQNYLNNLVSNSGASNGMATQPKLGQSQCAASQPSRAQMANMPLTDRVRALLKGVQLIHFERLLSIMHAMMPGADDSSVLRAVQQVAVMVQGCWVVKSDVLYPPPGEGQATGVNSREPLIHARDYMLWEFTQQRQILRSELAAKLKMPGDEVRSLLEQVATVEEQGTWQWKLSSDPDFINRYPDISQRQEMLWTQRQIILLKYFTAEKPPEDEKVKRRRHSSRSRSRKTSLSSGESPKALSGQPSSSGTSVSVEVQSNSNSNLVPPPATLTTGHQPVPMEAIGHQPVVMEKVNSNHGHFTSTMGPSGSVQQTTGPGSAVGTMEELASGGVPKLDYNWLKQAVRHAFSQSVFLSMLNLRALLEKAAGNNLPLEISSPDLDGVLRECGVSRLYAEGLSQSQPMFALAKTGDGHDAVRAVVLNSFKDKAKVRLSQMKEAIEAQQLGPVSEGDLKKVVKEYCVAKGGLWCLKCATPGFHDIHGQDGS